MKLQRERYKMTSRNKTKKEEEKKRQEEEAAAQVGYSFSLSLRHPFLPVSLLVWLQNVNIMSLQHCIYIFKTDEGNLANGAI